MRLLLGSIIVILAAQGGAVHGEGKPVALGSLASKAPADWKEQQATSQFRYKQFQLPRAEGDSADGDLIIYHFGAGGGGGVQANIARWKGMFEPPAGKKIDDVSKVTNMELDNAKITYLDVTGTYLFKPFPMARQAERRPGSRMLAVIFACEGGPYFIRVTGPEKTVAKHKEGFDKWLKGFE